MRALQTEEEGLYLAPPSDIRCRHGSFKHMKTKPKIKMKKIRTQKTKLAIVICKALLSTAVRVEEKTATFLETAICS